MLLPFCASDLDEGVEHVAPCPPPCREQFVALGEVARIRVGTFRPVVDLAPRMDVSPVLPARVQQEQVDLDVPGRLAEQLEVGGREGRHREEARAPRPTGRREWLSGRRRRGDGMGVRGRDRGLTLWRRLRRLRRRSVAHLGGAEVVAAIVSEVLAERVEGVDPVIGTVRAVRLHQALPQSCLPVGSRAALPLPDPVRAIEEALVEYPGEAVGEVEPLAGIPVRQVALYRTLPRASRAAGHGSPWRPARGVASRCALPRLPGRPRQEVMDAPPKPRRCVRLLPGELRYHAAHDRPGELGGLLEVDVGRDAEPARKLQREPPPDGGVRHDDPLGGKRIARIRTHEVCELGRESFQPVRMVKPYSRHLTTIRDRSGRAPKADVMCAPRLSVSRSRGGVGGGPRLRAERRSPRSMAARPPPAP